MAVKTSRIKSASITDSPKKRGETNLRYIEAVGRRKTSIARVRLFETNKPGIIVNNIDAQTYFPTTDLKHRAMQELLNEIKILSKLGVEAKIKGGGISSQANALRHGIARALVKFQPDLRKTLRGFDFLRRDPRMKERRKFGLKKARKAPQWSKR